MRRRLLPALAALMVVLAACGERADVLTPSAPSASSVQASPAPGPQQGVDAVMPGRILARLAEGTVGATVAQRNGVVFERSGPRGAYTVFRGAVGNERARASAPRPR